MKFIKKYALQIIILFFLMAGMASAGITGGIGGITLWYLDGTTLKPVDPTWTIEVGGRAPSNATYITQTASSDLSAEQALSGLVSGIMRVASTTGVITSLTDSAGISANISDETGTGVLMFATNPVLGGNLTFGINGTYLTAPNNNNGDYISFMARDSDTNSIVPVGTLSGAADPYFSFGGASEFKFYNSGDALVALNKKIEFGDSGVYIFSDDDGHLDLTADTSIDLNATTTFTGNVGIGTITPGFPLVVEKDAIAATSTTATQLQNATLSTAVATQQFSPSLQFTGHAWNTTAVAADNQLDARQYLSVTSGLTPSSTLTWGFQRAGGGFTDQMTLTSAGVLTVPSIVGTLTGNATTATALATGRTISISGDLTYTSPAFDGSANVTAAGTLATVNATTGSFGSSTSIPTFTVNAKGLITAASGNVVIAPAGTLTGATLAANVLASSLTSVGTLTGLTVTAAPTFSAMTAGSVLFAGTAGLLSQNNANFFWDNVNSRLGIGTTGPTYRLHLVGSDTTGMMVEGVANDTTTTNAYTRGLTMRSGVSQFNLGVAGTAFENAQYTNTSWIIASGKFGVGISGGAPTSFTVDTTGNVGIGTTTPAYTLQVLKTASSTMAIGDATHTGCIVMGDTDASGITYLTALNGVLTATSTKPTICE